MRKLIFLFLITLSCEKSEPEIIPPPKNTVFMVTAGDVGQFVIIRDMYNSYQVAKRVIKKDSQYSDPQCDSPYDNDRGYWILYLKPGIYELTVQQYIPISPGYVYKTITIHENSCNRFNLNQMDKWQ